jgi:hypothetical protein
MVFSEYTLYGIITEYFLAFGGIYRNTKEEKNMKKKEK